MSAATDPGPIKDRTRAALKQFATSVLDIAGLVGVEAFAEGTAHDVALDLVRNADQAFGTDLAGKVVTELDSNGLDIGDAHVSTQLALFAQGKVSSPIAELTVTNKRVIPLSSAVVHGGALAATCTLTTILTYERPDAKAQRIVNTTAKVALELEYTSPKKAVRAPL